MEQPHYFPRYAPPTSAIPTTIPLSSRSICALSMQIGVYVTTGIHISSTNGLSSRLFRTNSCHEHTVIRTRPSHILSPYLVDYIRSMDKYHVPWRETGRSRKCTPNGIKTPGRVRELAWRQTPIIVSHRMNEEFCSYFSVFCWPFSLESCFFIHCKLRLQLLLL